MDEAEQLLKDAKEVLPAFKFHFFEYELKELLKLPLVFGWHVRLLAIFKPILDCDNLTKRLFRIFQMHWRCLNQDLNFLESVYLHLDGGTYRRFYAEMLEFAGAGFNQRQIVGERLLGIVREREYTHQRECQISGTAFPFRFYEKFQILFEIYLKLTLSRYEQLLGIINEHESRGSPNNEYEMRRLRNVGRDFFGRNWLLIRKFVNFCTGDTVKSDLFAPIGMNHPFSNLQIWNNPTTVSTNTIGPRIQDTRIPRLVYQDTCIPNRPSPGSLIPVKHNYQVQCPSTLGTPASALLGKNHPVGDRSSPYSPKPDSVEHGHSVPGIRIPEHPTPVLVVPGTHNYPVKHGSSSNKQCEKHYSGWNPGYRFPVTPVEQRSTVNDHRTSKCRFRSSNSAFDYFEPLFRADPDLNYENVPPNRLPVPANPVEKSPANRLFLFQSNPSGLAGWTEA